VPNKILFFQAVFQKKFSTEIRRFLNPDHVEQINSELIDLLNSSDIALYKALNPTRTDSSCLSARSTGNIIEKSICTRESKRYGVFSLTGYL